ncbi:MAG TPA: formate dehydrogenase accessory sulfurtransferase FdhD [Thermoanaerobaculia bacterium]|jgi:FdhD protein|nr:formate dehydrogenase accessory sulfurtransferase FdhD [Thermoanaerobaculia bacterium]
MSESKTARVSITRIPGAVDDDSVVVEEPLEIRVGDKPVSVTLRTPGDDFDLAAGFLFTESIIANRGEIDSIRHWASPNVVRVALADDARVDLQRLQRHFYSTSSCGVCGKASIDALRVNAEPLDDDVRVSPSLLMSLPDVLRAQQTTFESTGAIHGAAAFTHDATLLRVREDVGRHNAVDKVIGSLFLEGASADILVVSGRTSFEIVQKCVVARIPILAAVGAPSSLAIELAHEFRLTLLGFVRDGRCNVYAGGERLS